MADLVANSVRLLRDGGQFAVGQEAIAEADRLLQAGEVVAIPTDTVYGVAAALTSEIAMRAIFRIKGRERTQTLPVLIPDMAAAGLLLGEDRSEDTPGRNRLLMLAERFWPGGLTVALPARPGLPAEVVAADGTVGLRVPDYAVTRTLLRLAGKSLAVTSANRSGAAPLSDAASVVRELGSSGLRWVLDAGPSGLAVASTVIGQSGTDLVIHRHGAVSERDLRRAWSEIIDSPDGGSR